MSDTGSGLSFSGKKNICASVGKILSIVAIVLLFVAAVLAMVDYSRSWPYYFVFFLLVLLFLVLMICALIGKPAVLLSYFKFITTNVGVMVSIFVLSFQVFPWYGNDVAKSFGFWAALITWIIDAYLIIIAILGCAHVL